MNLRVRSLLADRPRSPVAVLVAAVACALVFVETGWTRPAGTATAVGQEETRAAAQEPVTAVAPSAALSTRPTVLRRATSPFRILQMNLCLSGMAGCYQRVAYPAGVREAVARIRRTRPQAVTFNEACRRDVVRVARRTGYRLRFARVLYGGAPLHCVDPPRRGLFGNAVLTKAPIDASRQRPFRAQSGPERRTWLCVSTRRRVDVCTSHLETRRTGSFRAANDAQCAELRALLRRRASVRAVAFGGDVNRRGSCAPSGAWTRTDRAAGQAPGLQHVYGSPVLRRARVTVLRARHSDHDVLLVRARLVAR